MYDDERRKTMKVSCSQEALKRTLTACAILGRAYPVSTQVSLSAHASEAMHPAFLEVCTWISYRTIGLVARLPAQVEQAGRASVPAQVLADGLASTPPGQLTLSLVEIADPPRTPTRLQPLKAGPALQMESVWRSARGTTSTRRIRLCLAAATAPQGELQDVQEVQALPDPPDFPDLACWRTTGFRLAEVAAGRLRAALAPCLALAHQRDEPSEAAPDMNHALVLARFDPTGIQWTATTRKEVGSCHLSLHSPTHRGLDVPFSHVLFDEYDLAWMMSALRGVTSPLTPVTLTLVPYAAHQVALLLESSGFSFFCLGVTEPIPFAWEHRVQLEAPTAGVVSRTPFLQALSFFWGTREGENPYLYVHVSRDLLCLQGNTVGSAAIAIEHQIPLVKPAEEVPVLPILVNLKQLRQAVRLLKGKSIRLAVGTFRLKGSPEATISFLRLAVADDPTTQFMMTITCHASPASPASPASSPAHQVQNEENMAPLVRSVQPEVEQKETVLAPVR